MKTSWKPADICRLMLFLVASAVLVGCSGTGDDAGLIDSDRDASTTEVPPSGETLDDATNATPSSSTSTLADASTEGEGGQADSANGGSTVEPVVDVGATVLAQQDFSEYFGEGFESRSGGTSVRVGLIANSASMVDDRHVADVLFEAGADSRGSFELVALFSPEHGFRSDAPAGATVADSADATTGLPIYSLYGSTKQPTAAMLDDLDVLVFDMQDVGARYYTYISTMGLAMQAAAQNDLPFVVFDRPNPLGGNLVSGFVRDAAQESFISQYPIPAVYGMTAAELAQAIVGESWIDGVDSVDLWIVPMQGWHPDMAWADTGLVWFPPSPGLPTAESALTYPATVAFEATTWSYGQGSDAPFTQVGRPGVDGQAMADELNEVGLAGVQFVAAAFTPKVTPSGPEPRFLGELTTGVAIEVTDPATFDPVEVGVYLLASAQRRTSGTLIDRGPTFDLLAGTSQLRSDLSDAKPPADIVDRWRADVEEFRVLTEPYVLYPFSG